MKLRHSIRLTLATLLAIIGFAVSFGVLKDLQFISLMNFNILYILGLLGEIAILVFIYLTTRNLINNKSIPKDVYAISVILSLVSAIVVLMFAYGVFKDLSGAYCSGFFGARTSCLLSPLLILLILILNPISLIVGGAISVYGIYRQSSHKTK